MIETITTTTGQTYEVIERRTIRGIEVFSVKLKNSRMALVYKYKSGLIKKVTKGL